MDKQEVTINERFKVVHVDSMNWQLFERREIKRGDRSGKGKSRVGEIDWIALPAFFGTLRAALAKAKELNRDRNLPDCGMAEAVDSIGKLDAAFMKQLDRALKEAAR